MDDRPAWLTWYAAGVAAGYASRCAEEAEAWQGQQWVFSAGQFFNRRTAAELRDERIAVLIEAHEAEFHDDRPAVGCPRCIR